MGSLLFTMVKEFFNGNLNNAINHFIREGLDDNREALMIAYYNGDVDEPKELTEFLMSRKPQKGRHYYHWLSGRTIKPDAIKEMKRQAKVTGEPLSIEISYDYYGEDRIDNYTIYDLLISGDFTVRTY